MLIYNFVAKIPKLIGLLNDPLCAYSMRQNLHHRTCLRSINVLAMFENDLRKTVNVRVLTEIVNACNWKMCKKKI